MAQEDKKLHQTTEAIAVLFIVPFLLFLIIKYKNIFTRLEMFILLLISSGTLLIDGYLLTTW